MTALTPEEIVEYSLNTQFSALVAERWQEQDADITVSRASAALPQELDTIEDPDHQHPIRDDLGTEPAYSLAPETPRHTRVAWNPKSPFTTTAARSPDIPPTGMTPPAGDQCSPSSSPTVAPTCASTRAAPETGGTTTRHNHPVLSTRRAVTRSL